MPVLTALRNKTPNVVVLTPDPSDPKSYLTFEAAGDPGGGDCQYIPESTAVNSPPIVKAILHEILETVDQFSPEAQQSFQQQMAVAKQQRERASQAVQDSLLRENERDMIGVHCIGPGATSASKCDVPIPMKAEAIRSTPPLCARHRELAPQYIPTDHFDAEKSEHKTEWVRAQLGERKREGDPV